MPHTTRLALSAVALAVGAGLAGCGGATSASGSPPVVASVQAARHLGVSEFAALAADPSVIVLDVRTPEEFSAGHLARAVNLDLRAPDFPAQLSTLDRNQRYAVYCHSGNRSGQALEQMQAAGFTQVSDLSGGITSWTQTGHEIVTS